MIALTIVILGLVFTTTGLTGMLGAIIFKREDLF